MQSRPVHRSGRGVLLPLVYLRRFRMSTNARPPRMMAAPPMPMMLFGFICRTSFHMKKRRSSENPCLSWSAYVLYLMVWKEEWKWKQSTPARYQTEPALVVFRSWISSCDIHTIVSSRRKSMIPIFRMPFSSYHLFRISCRTRIFGKESPVRLNGLFSVTAFSSVSSA